jgi:hypothetical protein
VTRGLDLPVDEVVDEGVVRERAPVADPRDVAPRQAFGDDAREDDLLAGP